MFVVRFFCFANAYTHLQCDSWKTFSLTYYNLRELLHWYERYESRKETCQIGSSYVSSPRPPRYLTSFLTLACLFARLSTWPPRVIYLVCWASTVSSTALSDLPGVSRIRPGSSVYSRSSTALHMARSSTVAYLVSPFQ